MRHLLTTVLVVIAWACAGADWNWDPASRLTGDEKKAWTTFIAGVKSLQDNGNRKRAAKLFEQVAKEFPESGYAADSKELSGLLRQMVEEDKRWTEPRAPGALPLERKIAYYTYHLRDVNCYQMGQPGMCHVLMEFGQKRPGTNAAMRLKEIGEPAIPALIQLLEDRRPTRSVGYWRNFSPSRTVLRFQDAAIQILDALLPTAFYNRKSTAAYFSTESAEVRERVIRSIKSWYRSSLGKPEVEKKWLAVEAPPGIHQLMALLKELALEHGQKERVLATLRQICNQRSPLQLPQISYLMCQLGDCGKVDAVVTAYLAGQYGGATSLPDDSAAGLNAEENALRQVILYGTEAQRNALKKNAERKDDPLNKRRDLLAMLVNLAEGRGEELPTTYPRSQFPLEMLVDVLTNKEEWTSGSQGSKQWTIRQCDEAAEAIQKFTGEHFGFDAEKSEKEKDEAISRILDWWQKRPKKPEQGSGAPPKKAPEGS